MVTLTCPMCSAVLAPQGITYRKLYFERLSILCNCKARILVSATLLLPVDDKRQPPE